MMLNSQPKIILAGILTAIFAVLTTLFFLRCLSAPNNGMISFGSMRFSWELIMLFVALILCEIAHVWLVITGFRCRWTWGLGLLFFFPVAAPTFFFAHTDRAKRPTLVLLAGTVFLLITVLSTKLH